MKHSQPRKLLIIVSAPLSTFLWSSDTGVGTPVQLRSNNLQGQNIPATQIPTSQEAVAAYENLGGRLKVFPSFGVDPLADNVALQDVRERRFNSETDMATVFGDIVNGTATSFEQAIQRYANLTTQLLP